MFGKIFPNWQRNKRSDLIHYQSIILCFELLCTIPNPVTHSRHRLAMPSPQMYLLQFAIYKNCKTTDPKVENEISNIVHVV